jgi:hypothetical protein
MPHSGESDESLDPLAIRLLRAKAVMLESKHLTHLIQELWFGSFVFFERHGIHILPSTPASTDEQTELYEDFQKIARRQKRKDLRLITS